MACGAEWPPSHRFCAHCGTPRSATGSADGDVADVVRSLVGSQLTDQLVAEGGRLPEQRRLVTALFADLSGFTPLAGRLDPEELASVVDPLLEGLVRVVARHEGYVGSFAGDALLAFFGAPVAHEDDAERALRAALQMLEEFPALLAAAGPSAQSLSLRIGVDTGAVLARLVAGDVRTDYSVMGNAVNMAQRLQSHAPPGGCWLGETTYRLTHEAFELESRGLIQVKGRAEPLAAWELVADRTRSVARRRQRVRSLLGRSVELAAVTAVLDGKGARGLLLRGEAGVGKSRLVEAARELTHAARWLEGGGAAHDRATSYRLWLPVVAALGGELVLDAPTPAARRRAVADLVGGLLRGAAPAVVALEDLHWADQPSLDLLDDLLHELDDADVLLLATSRGPVTTTADLPAVDVAPLSESAVGSLVEELLEGSPPDELVADVARRSGGNPLYAAELARALQDRGLVRRVEGDVLVAAGADLAAALDLVPDTLEGLVGARIDALPTAQSRVLTVAAVLGTPVRADLVGAVVARVGGQALVEPELAALREEGLLAGSDFVHAVVQDTAYARTPRKRRRELHLAAAEVGPAVLDATELPGHLARHLYLGGAGARAVDALQAAADLAASHSALEEAVLHLTREVELRRDDPSQRASLPDRLTVLGEHLEVLGRYADAEPLLREALSLGADARATRALAGCLRRLGRYDEAIETADPSAAGGADDDLLGLVLEERAWSLAATGQHDLAVETASSSGSWSERVSGRLALVRAYCLAAGGHPGESRDAAAEAGALLLANGDEPSAARALRLQGDAEWRAGELDAARASLTAGRALAESVAAWEEVAACTVALASLAVTNGDLVLGLAEGRRAMHQLDRMGHRFGRVLARANLADTLLEADELDAAADTARTAIAMAEEAGLPGLRAIAQGTLADIDLADGRPADAYSLAARAATELEELAMVREAAQVWGIAARAAEALGHEDDAEAARRSADRLEIAPLAD